MRRLLFLFVPLSILLIWGAEHWNQRRSQQGAQQWQADLIAQSLDAFRQHEGRLPCPAADGEGREACGGEGAMQEGAIPWRALDMHRASVNATLRLRVARVYTQPRILDRLPVDALCRSGLYPDIPLGDEMAAQILAAEATGGTASKPLVTLRRWQLRPHPEAGTPAHLYAEAERKEDDLLMRWGTLCGGSWFVQRQTQFSLPRPWPNRRSVEWAASRQGQRGAIWEPGVAHPLFTERTGAQWKSVDLLSKEALENLTPHQIAWSGDGRWLAILTEEGEPRLWDCRSLPCARADLNLPEERFPAIAATRSLAFGNGDALILTTASAPHLLIGQRHGERWDWLPTEHWNLPATPRLARLGADGHHVLWEIGGHLSIASWLNQPENPFLSGMMFPEGTNAWALSPDGHWLAALSDTDIRFFARDGAGWYERQRQSLAAAPAHEKPLAVQWEDARTLLILGLTAQTRFSPPPL